MLQQRPKDEETAIKRELSEFRREIYSLGKNKELVYYSGVTPNYLSKPIVKEKFNIVMGAYNKGVIVPIQVAVGKLKGLNTYDYIAKGI